MKKILCYVLLISLLAAFSIAWTPIFADEDHGSGISPLLIAGKGFIKNVYVDDNGFFRVSRNDENSSFCIPKNKFKKYKYLSVKAKSNYSNMIYILKNVPKRDGEKVCYSSYYYNSVPVWRKVKLDILIPKDANYIIIPYKSGGKIIYPYSVDLCTSNEFISRNSSTNDIFLKDSFINSHRFMHWNIGHFSKGEMPYSTITKDNYVIKYWAFKNFINKYFVDCHCLFNEYDEEFAKIDGVNIIADTVLFGEKRSYALFPRSVTYGFNKLASFWKSGVIDFKYGIFESLKGVKNKMGMLEYGTGYCISYYRIGKSILYVMSFHAPHEISQEDYKALHSEILEICSKFENIILVGDFNQTHISDFDLLTDAGFKILNDKSKTFPRGKCILDWVLYRCEDVVLSDFKVYEDAMDSNGDLLSDHLPLSFIVTRK